MTEVLQRLGADVGAWLYVIAGGLAFGAAAMQATPEPPAAGSDGAGR